MDRNTLADVVMSLPDAVVVIDPGGGVLWTNDAAERLFGHTGAEMVGTNALDAVHLDDRELAAVALTGCPGRPVGTRLELRVRTDEGWSLVEVTAAHAAGHGADDN